ncbi:OmpH family outer membrane protein [Sphingosinicella sp. YJ22]|uniref:OmpH family outer membrane protein n=1 Tax=Sphingosinicella sp. YJ22 TaxID=1104780 RepID=UPI0014079699|nr:OmpH family outer membrane protein [Sphingosinicella sp. YJ22]
MKTKLLAAAVIAAALPTGAIAQQRVPAAVVAVVNTDRVLRECVACVSATAALQAQDTNFQQRRQALLGPLQPEEQALQAEVTRIQGLSGAARTAAENALRPRVEAFNQRRQTAAQELQTLQQNFESTRVHVGAQLNRALEPIYSQVMTARGANLIISTDARLGNAPALDVTNDVLAQLNRALPAVSITPMPQQAPAAQPAQPQPQQPRPQGR